MKLTEKGSRFWLPFLFFALVMATWPVALANDAPSVDRHPIKLDTHGRLLVDVQVSGQGPYPFLLDTAASRTVLYRTLVSLLELEAIPFKSTRVMTATGSREMQIYRVGSLNALGRNLDVPETVAMPDPMEAEQFGILGVDLMRGRTLLLDGAEAHLLDTVDDLPDVAWYRIQGRPVGPRSGPSVAVTVSIGGLELPAIVDTGAGLTVLNEAALEALQAAKSGTLSTSPATLSAAGGTIRAQMVQLPALQVGDWYLPERRVAVAQLPVFVASGAANVPAMILGADVLLEAPALAIDFSRWALFVRRQ